jgi:anti-sigma B factor antagonist
MAPRTGRCAAEHDVSVPAERQSHDPRSGDGLSGVLAVESHGEACVLKLAGDLDAVKARQVAEVVDAILSRRPRTLILDLRKVTFVASAGAHLVLESSARTGTDVRIVAAPDAGIWETAPAEPTDAIAVFSTLENALAYE